jgi:hypothetical protein
MYFLVVTAIVDRHDAKRSRIRICSGSGQELAIIDDCISLLHAHWTCALDLLCVMVGGRVLVYNLYGVHLKHRDWTMGDVDVFYVILCNVSVSNLGSEHVWNCR